jgi:hypothetical protein
MLCAIKVKLFANRNGNDDNGSHVRMDPSESPTYILNGRQYLQSQV